MKGVENGLKDDKNIDGHAKQKFLKLLNLSERQCFFR